MRIKLITPSTSQLAPFVFSNLFTALGEGLSLLDQFQHVVANQVHILGR